MAWHFEEPTEESLNHFIAAQPETSYLQSWQWGLFQQSLGRTVVRQMLFGDAIPVAAMTLIHQPLPMVGGYGYIPKGPVVHVDALNGQSVWKELTMWLRQYNQRQRFLFTQIEPPTSDHSLQNIVRSEGWRQAPGVQPTDTQVIDLTKPEAQLLAAMRPKTRYNIGLAQRKGVTIQWHGAEAIDAFWKLVEETNARDGISSFAQTYYAKMMTAFGASAHLVAAAYQGAPLAMSLVITCGDTVTYAHGGSTNQQRSVMAPQLLHWETIRWAKQQGFRYYDFRGIAPTDDPNHHWAGITRFKKGFGGVSVHHLGAFDLVNRLLLYRLYRLYRRG